MNQEERFITDRYLENSLTGVELKNFLDKLESDDNFKKDVSFHNLLIEGIVEAEDNRLEDSIIKSINYHKPVIPVALKLILTFLIVTGICITLWNYISPDSSGKKHDYFSLNFLHNSKKDTANLNSSGDKILHSKRNELKTLNILPDTSHQNKSLNHTDSTKMNLSEAADIVVKKDQLLISYTLKSKNLNDKDSIENSSESSLAKNAAEKLNPSGGLPDDEKNKSENYNVEFWVSPVNYKGYKLVNDKLILFGIEVPDAVQLFSKDEKLWMKYGHEVFILEPTEEFESLVHTNEIPLEIK